MASDLTALDSPRVDPTRCPEIHGWRNPAGRHSQILTARRHPTWKSFAALLLYIYIYIYIYLPFLLLLCTHSFKVEADMETLTLTLTGLLKQKAEEFPSRRALSVSGKLDLTHARLDELIDKAASLLLASGINPGDVVALTFPNTIEVSFPPRNEGEFEVSFKFWLFCFH